MPFVVAPASGGGAAPVPAAPAAGPAWFAWSRDDPVVAAGAVLFLAAAIFLPADPGGVPLAPKPDENRGAAVSSCDEGDAPVPKANGDEDAEGEPNEGKVGGAVVGSVTFRPAKLNVSGAARGGLGEGDDDWPTGELNENAGAENGLAGVEVSLSLIFCATNKLSRSPECANKTN